MEKLPSWLAIIIPAMGTITGMLMLLLGYLTLREKHSERAMVLYKQTTDMRIAALEHEVEYGKDRLSEAEKEHEECLQRVALLTAEKHDLLSRLYQRPRRSPPA